MATRRNGGGPGNGLPIDHRGGPSVDPTPNVKDLMEVSIKALARESELQALLVDEKIKRMEREITHQDERAGIFEGHTKEIRIMESERVNSIRSVDVSNAAATAAQLLSAVQNLERTAQATAETLRNQVASTAQAAAAGQAALINPIVERVALLEKSSYTGAGKAGVADPAFERLSTLVERLANQSQNTAGRGQGMDATWKIIVAAIGILFGFLAWQDRQAPAASVAPQVIYVPAPAAGTGAPLPGVPVSPQ